MIGRIARIAALLVLALAAPALAAPLPTYGYQIVHVYPHDRTAFTEGLFYLGGYLYESTGLNGHSQIRLERLDTGETVMSHDLPAGYFGEGITAWHGKLYQLTWRSHVGFIYNLADFKPIGGFSYPGEGWALTTDGRRLIMSDGTPQIRFLDPKTLKEVRRVTVTTDGGRVANINELEWVKGEIFANVWMTDKIIRIDPASGRIKGWIDLAGILPAADQSGDRDDVLNGIAYDAANDRLFVTGKRWPKLFEIKLVPKP
jgi:glutaminyl-peptide cyclotransferase